MKLQRLFLFFFLSIFLFASCEKEDAEAAAKNKALKEKVAKEMKQAASLNKKKGSKTTSKSKTNKGANTKKAKKKIDPILANLPNNKAEKKEKNDPKKGEVGSQVVKKEIPKKDNKIVVAKAPKQITYHPAVIEIVANFDEADATINGIAYPEYTPQGEEGGMILPAGGPYSVEVKFGDKAKYYEIFLKPNETRILFVSSNGAGSAPKKYPKKIGKVEKKAEKKEKTNDKKAPGKVTVYGKPKGTIIVDGVEKSESTPGTIEMENGRHEIQVKYKDSGELSEKKIVRVRGGSKIKLFFRERKK